MPPLKKQKQNYKGPLKPTSRSVRMIDYLDLQTAFRGWDTIDSRTSLSYRILSHRT